MEINYAPKGILEINDARIIFRNFRGVAGPYNDEGDRSFHIIIPDMETANELLQDTNRFGVGWNVKIKQPREEGDTPFIHMPVKVKYTDRSGPKIHLISGENEIEITEETVGMLDDIDIRSIDMDIRPFDGEARGQAFRAAYLQRMWIVQELDRFEARLAKRKAERDI